MGLMNLKRVSNHRVEKWLVDSIPELTKYQKERIRDDEIVRFSRFEFYERRKKVENIWLRLTVFFALIMWAVLFIGLPFNFIVTGSWGYNKIEWFSKWCNACGLRT